VAGEGDDDDGGEGEDGEDDAGGGFGEGVLHEADAEGGAECAVGEHPFPGGAHAFEEGFAGVFAVAEEEVTDRGEEDAAPDALVGGGDAVDVFAGRCGDFVGFAADDGTDALSECGDDAEENSEDECATREVEVFARSEGYGDSREDDEAAEDLAKGEGVIEPDPFEGGADGCGEAMEEDHGEPGADSRESLVEGEVADAEADDAAEEEKGQGFAGEASADGVGVEGEEKCGDENAKEIGFESADETAEAAAGDGREGEEDGGEERGERSGLEVGLRSVGVGNG
jgi:hypothetical protein